MTRDFEGKVAIVTGAAGALGGAVTGQLVERGASVVAVDVEPVTERGTVAAIEGDVSVAATAERAVSVARERFGGLDVLVCNAGQIVWKPIVETTEEEWDRVQSVNAKGTFLFCRAAIPAMRERGGGAIVCTASISGVVGLPLQSAYSASKGAIVQLTRQLAVELAPDIRVNAVAPGAIDTPFLHRLVESSERPRRADRGDRGRPSAATDRLGGRGRADDRLPRVGRGRVRDGRDPARRRRLHGEVGLDH